LHYLTSATQGWKTEAYTCSSITGKGISEIWEIIERFKQTTQQSGVWKDRRRLQARDWLYALVEEHLRHLFKHHPDIKSYLPEIEKAVMAGKLPVTTAAKILIDKFEK